MTAFELWQLNKYGNVLTEGELQEETEKIIPAAEIDFESELNQTQTNNYD